MANKILVDIPDMYAKQLDEISKELKKSKSELICSAIEMYINQLNLNSIGQSLKNGYEQMSEINLTLAEMYFESDLKTLSDYEEKLSESEKCEY